MKAFTLLAALFAFSAQGLYTSSSPVVKLTKDNFKKLVLDSDQLWFIEFFAPWCGHCKQLAPAWEKAAKTLKGVVNVGAVDMTTDQEAGAAYGIQGFPTIKFFGFDKQKPQDYQGQRDDKAIVDYALEKVGSEVRKRSSGKGASSSSSSSGSKKKETKQENASGASDKDVTVLNQGNFDELVLGSKDIWLVEFYAPWCGHCKNLEPEWNQAATRLKGQVKLGKVDATVETALAQRFHVQGYPTIKVFDYGEGKSDSRAKDYEGSRDANGIVSYASGLLDKADVAPEVHELITQDVYDKNCKGQVICIVSFLPHLFDSDANQRRGYIQAITTVAKKNRRHPFQYFWLQAGDQLDLERQLNLGFGYPAVVAISPNKSKIGVLKGSFSETKLAEFLAELMSGKVALDDLKGKVVIQKAGKWDGSDLEPIKEESYGDEL
ncbi:hypothetical protein FGO68_gene16110 [Halteria grandinella]|uniref:protein disulfide-isomerase n=1 Tax=Halteria grandinella TaxID=5974 RepID=A0A8J8SY43_HALGN|nr:hypothetical protein FGO68_gene16110 [Halteria grandinella]